MIFQLQTFQTELRQSHQDHLLNWFSSTILPLQQHVPVKFPTPHPTHPLPLPR